MATSRSRRRNLIDEGEASEIWAPILEFPDYSISDQGRVKKEHTGRLMALTRNQSGLCQVGLMRQGRQYKRGVALLVAKAFLDPPALGAFNTPINLDGDRLNNVVENLMWRPRWFAVKYHSQFHNIARDFDRPVIEIRTGERFEDTWPAAMKYGLLEREIRLAALSRTYVWPTYQEFRLIDE